MATRSSQGSAAHQQAAINEAVLQQIGEMGARLSAVEAKVNSMAHDRAVDGERQLGQINVRAVEDQVLRERLSALEKRMAEDAVSKTGLTWTWLKTLLVSLPSIISVILALLIFAEKCATKG